MIRLTLSIIKKYFNLKSQVGGVMVYEYRKNKAKTIIVSASHFYYNGFISVFSEEWELQIDTFEGLIKYLKNL